MSTRITKLAADAGIHFRFSNPHEIWGYDVALTKFAELIKQECITAVTEQTDTRHAITSYDAGVVMATIERSVKAIKETVL